MWDRVHSSDPDLKMPPPDSNKELTPGEIELLGRWIREGAQYQKHWAFEPLVESAIPPQAFNGKNTIDAFVGKRLESQGWKLAEQANKSTLIRRVAFTLTGLPPTSEELDAYMTDPSADAYEKMVDRYLQSNRYGEEMARHWLDIARYADTHGLHLDNERQMWAYRDWVVKSFNRNMPFDQFTIEQLAVFEGVVPGTMRARVAGPRAKQPFAKKFGNAYLLTKADAIHYIIKGDKAP
jgi:hypothetical protein